MEPERPPLDYGLKKNEAIAGFVYFPLHFLVLPLLLSLATVYIPGMTELWGTLAYYALGAVFLAVFMMPYLQRQFDALLDSPLKGLFSVAGAYMINMALSYAVALLLIQFVETGENPNDQTIFSLVGREFNITKALAIFIAPVLEETLFRGVLFGGLYRRGRILAYITAILLFSFYHVWEYALATMDPRMLVYMLQYLPVSFALCWCYERSGSLWAPIALHMFLNAVTFAALPYIA
jgi:membrane protease YdiL (CAAX protease family)